MKSSFGRSFFTAAAILLVAMTILGASFQIKVNQFLTDTTVSGLQQNADTIAELAAAYFNNGGMMESEEKTLLGYIPAGSTNDFANSLRIPKSMLKAANVAVKGRRFPVDIGYFNGDSFVYVAAFGLFTAVSYQTSQQLKNVLGHAAYILEGMKQLLDIPVYKMRVEYDDEVLEDEFIYGMITNSISVGGFKNLTGKNVLLDDGVFVP